ncbi:glycosyltransferase family 4 protein [bacterium (Candidatus Torokbacteria) CG09_land_8_20_14_0_10_42_11]|nr:MAG: glycosyltransferase family 4 protein [bacterium (Candidatus Torokbacteria) CG09_land_8_20_14_0_10_42_11]
MRVALVHDHLAQDGGAERVLAVFHKIYPEAPIFVLVYNRAKANRVFRKAKIKTSFIQKMPLGQSRYQWYLPFMPMAFEKFNLFNYDLVLSSTSAFAKGVITDPKTLHLCYCHTPTRYLWSDTHSYTKELKYNRLIKKFIPFILHKIRIWDRLAADRVDYFIANSENIRRKIKKYYRREATVIYAPADLDKFRLASNRGNYFLTGGRLVAYKKFDLTIKVFNRLGWPLKIFGAGPEIGALKKMARPNIEFLGRISDQALSSLYAEAKAFIFPQEEDLGITALESMAAGRPVIAFASGGALETVIPGKTGILFGAQTIDALSSAVKNFKESDFNPEEIREYVSRFDAKIFEQKIKIFIEEAKSKYYGAKTNQAQIKPLSVG